MARNRRLTGLLILGLAVMTHISCGGKKVAVAYPPAATGAPAPQDLETLEPKRSTPAARNLEAKIDAPLAAPPATPAELTDNPARPRLETSVAKSLVETALGQLGVPYKWGGEQPDQGFDCSGLVHWTFSQHGARLPRSTDEQIQVGESVSPEELQPGDLLFYAWGSDRGKVSHVGIYVGNGEYVHSPGAGRSVERAPAFDPSSRNRFITARRIALTAPPQSAETAPDPDTRSYIVQAGDYIWALARRFKVPPALLLEINQLRIDDILQVGQRLKIPGGMGNRE